MSEVTMTPAIPDKVLVPISDAMAIDPTRIEGYDVQDLDLGEVALVVFYMHSGNKFTSCRIALEFADEFIEAVLKGKNPFEILQGIKR